MFQVNNEDTSATSGGRSNVFIVKFEHILPLFLMFLSLTLNRKCLIRTMYTKPVQCQNRLE